MHAHEARVEENHQSALSDALWVNVAQTMPKYKSVTSHPTSNPSPLIFHWKSGSIPTAHTIMVVEADLDASEEVVVVILVNRIMLNSSQHHHFSLIAMLNGHQI